MKSIYSIFLVLCLLFIHQFGFTKDKEPEIGIVEKLNEIIPADIQITGEDGKSVNLKQIINKPTVLNLVYYRCPGICSPVMQGVAEMVEKSDLVLGEDYQIVTVSFNPKESIELAIDKKKNFVVDLKKQELAQKHWKFYISDSSSITKLTNSVGFKYKKMGNDFTHTGTLIMLSPKGKITRYLNGTYFLPLEFKLALLESAEGKVGSTINRFLQFCYAYDPVGQRYAMNVTRITGGLILFLGIFMFITLVFARRKKIAKKLKLKKSL